MSKDMKPSVRASEMSVGRKMREAGMVIPRKAEVDDLPRDRVWQRAIDGRAENVRSRRRVE